MKLEIYIKSLISWISLSRIALSWVSIWSKLLSWLPIPWLDWCKPLFLGISWLSLVSWLSLLVRILLSWHWVAGSWWCNCLFLRALNFWLSFQVHAQVELRSSLNDVLNWWWFWFYHLCLWNLLPWLSDKLVLWRFLSVLKLLFDFIYFIFHFFLVNFRLLNEFCFQFIEFSLENCVLLLKFSF